MPRLVNLAKTAGMARRLAGSRLVRKLARIKMTGQQSEKYQKILAVAAPAITVPTLRYFSAHDPKSMKMNLWIRDFTASSIGALLVLGIPEVLARTFKKARFLTQNKPMMGMLAFIPGLLAMTYFNGIGCVKVSEWAVNTFQKPAQAKSKQKAGQAPNYYRPTPMFYRPMPGSNTRAIRRSGF